MDRIKVSIVSIACFQQSLHFKTLGIPLPSALLRVLLLDMLPLHAKKYSGSVLSLLSQHPQST